MSKANIRNLSIAILLLSSFLASCGTTAPMGESDTDDTTANNAPQKIEKGKASWYGPNFHGKLTANGEKYDMHALTAAHRTLPFNSIIKVKNLDNGQSVKVRINDRGPYAKSRIIDLSKKAAQKIDMLGAGTAHVELILMEGSLDNSRVTDLKVPTYTVQLASYREKDKAFTHSQEIEGARVETIILDSQKVYRIYYGRYTNKDRARQKQRMLSNKGYKGYVKQIEN